MTWQETGLHLINIGERSARFRDLTLPFSRDDEPVESVIWLPNGGGKSSIMALRSAVVLPGARDFTGYGRDSGKEKRPRTLEDYVDDGTSHTVISWSAEESGALLPRRRLLLTGAVYEWPSRRRPTEEGARLNKVWWSALPKPGVLDMESVPVRNQDGRLRTLNEFKNHLVALNADHPDLQIQVATTQSQWERQLTDLNVDTQLARYQALMNTSEGGIAKVFDFSSTSDFIDFMVKVTCTERDAHDVAEVLNIHADNLRRQPEAMLEQTFLTESLTLLQDLADRQTRVLDAQRDEESVHAGAAALRRRLFRSGVDCRARAEIAEGRATTNDEIATEHRRKRDQVNRYRLALRARAAADHHTQATQALADAEANVKQARRDEITWTVAAHMADARSSDAEKGEVLELLQPERREREDLRRRHDVAAVALRDLLRQQAGDHAEAARASGEQQQRHEATIDDLKRQRTAAQCRLDAAKTERTQADTRLQVHQEALDSARDEGVLLSGEKAFDAQQRHEHDEQAAEQSADGIESSVADERARAQDLGVQLTTMHKTLPEQSDAAKRAQDSLETLHRRRDNLVASQRLADIAEADELDPWGDGPRIRTGLTEAIRSGEERLLVSAINDASDQRLLAGVERAGLLPASVVVEDVVAALVGEGLQAEAAWTVLARDFSDLARAHAAMSRPDIVSGVVLQTANHRDQASQILASSPVLEHVALVTVDEIAAAADGRAADARVPAVPLDRGLYDHAAAASRAEMLRELDLSRARERTRLRTLIEADKALESEISGFLAEYPTRESLTNAQAALEKEERGLTRLNEQITLIGEQKEQAEKRAIEFDRQAITERRRADASNRLARHARRLAQDDERMANVELERKQAHSEIGLLEREIGGYDEEIEKTEDLAAVEKEAAAEAERHATAARQRASQIRVEAPGEVSDPDAVADLTRLGLTEASARYETLNRQWQNAASSSALEERLASISRRHTESVEAAEEALARLDGDRPAVRHAADNASADSDARTCRQHAEATRAQADVWVAKAERARVRAEEADNDLKVARNAAEKAPLRTGEQIAYTTSEEAERDATAYDEEFSSRIALETESREEAEQQRTLAEELRGHATQFEQWAGLLPAEASDADDAPSEVFDGPPSVAAETVTRTRAGLEGANTAVAEARRVRQEVAARAMRLAGQDRFQGVKLTVKHRMSSESPEVLGKAAASYAEEIQTRIKTIEGLLSQIEGAWQRVTDTAASKVRTLLTGINETARSSTLPPGLGEMSGNQFVKIGFVKPTEEQLSSRVGQEIMSVLNNSTGRSLPTGQEMLLKCVRAAVGNQGFNVRVLKPNEHMTLERRPVVDVSKFSDGERLTTCVLLFCALARTRMRRTSFSTATGTLMLDNPFGQASSAQLVALQLKVAAAQNVHLVYATGLEDMGALAQFRSVLRLRNRKAAGSNGFVQQENQARHGQVTAVTVSRPSAPSAARPEVEEPAP